jgi:response regulator of citrate/malate metabolism
MIVEDDVVVAEVNKGYVEQVPGFAVVGTAHSGAQAMALACRQPVDLVLLDFGLPDTTGIALCMSLRANSPRPVDIIAVTAAKDVRTVREAIAVGVVQYLIKPYSFVVFREKLERYAAFHRTLTGDRITDQRELDRTLGTLRGSANTGIPKGLSPTTHELVVRVLREATDTLSANEVADATGLSRVSARRYLEHLHAQGLAELSQRYGGTGRPEHRYRWADN